MTAVAELKPDTPTACVKCHEDYRYALQRIGEIEDAKPNSMEALELEMLKAAIAVYEAREPVRTG